MHVQPRVRDDPRIQPIVAAFYAVFNHFGPGLSESIYSRALEVELRARGHVVAREVSFKVYYRGQAVGWQRIDMVVDGVVVVENKAGEKLAAFSEHQLMAYLALTPFTVGLVLHFGDEPRYKRLTHTTKSSAAGEWGGS
jgi:GxxExxY protein